MSPTPAENPVEIRNLKQEGLEIEWEDGHRSIYPSIYLRDKCPCASCIDEWTGRKVLREEDIPKDIRVVSLEAVGLYAIGIQWSDGHDSGIYSFDHLRNICPCEVCRITRG